MAVGQPADRAAEGERRGALTFDRLFALELWLIAFLFSLVSVFMLYSFVHFRRRDGDMSDGEHFEGHTQLEIVWTAVPLLLVIVFGFIGVRALNSLTAVADEEITVKVNSFQWNWSFEYPEGFVSTELVLPVDERAHMAMEATDVLHSFWVPEFRVKQDIVPGQVTDLRFTPTLVGQYKLRCAELCGLDALEHAGHQAQ